MRQQLECGTAFADITPVPPVEMIGMGTGNHAVGVESPLELRVFTFRQGGRGFSLATCDLLCIDSELTGEIRTAIEPAAANVFSEYELFISCSHTHWGPGVTSMRDDQKHNQTYRQFLKEKIIDCLRQSFEGFTKVCLSLGKTRCGWNVNRRVTVDGEAFMLPLLPELTYRADGLVDHEVIVAAFTDPDGKYKAILFNYGCHPIEFPIHYDRISSAFPGETARQLREKFNCLCGFTNGGLGDVCSIGALQGAATKEFITNSLVRRIGELLESGQMQPYPDPELVAGSWHIPVAIQNTENGDWQNLFGKYDRAKPFSYPLGYYRIGQWAAGTVAGECTAEPALDFKKKVEFQYAHICSLTNGTWGYLLYRSEYARKGYEPTAALTEGGETEKIIESLAANAK